MSTLRSIRRGRGRRYLFLGATLVAAAAFGVVFVASSGANLPGSTFEGNDGNMVVNTAGHTDWASLSGNPGLRTLVDLPSGSNDNAFGQGSKENDTNVTVVTGSIPPNKNDLTRAYLFNEQAGGQSFLYLAWERAAAIGDAHIDFELNQNATPGFDGSTTGSVTLNRTVGDLLISYDFGGSGTPDITLFTWDGTQWTNPQDLSALGFAEAAVNSSDISDVLNNNTPLAAGEFGEASLNLTSALLAAGFNPDTCQSFGSIMVKARSSGSSTSAELKDFIAPVPFHASNCATPVFSTQTSVSSMSLGDTQTVGDTATLSGGNNPTGNVSFQLYSDSNCQNAVAGVSGSAALNAGGVATFTGASFTPAHAGTYFWGVSYAGDNHNNATSACGGPNEEIVVNAPSLSITKTADASTVDAGDAIGFTITVANGGPGTAKNVTLSDPLPAGTATAWSIDSGPASCSVSGAVGSQSLDCTAVDLGSGDSFSVHVTSSTSFADCTAYDNTATAHATNAPDVQDSATITCLKPSLSITKAADAATVDAGDPIGFTITVSNGGPGTAKNVTVSDPLPGGTDGGWSIDAGPANCSISGAVGSQSLDCTAADLASGDSFAVHITAGTSFANCTTYDNTATAHASNAPDAQDSASIECQKPSLSVTKTADAASVNAGDPIGFTVTVANGGPGTAKNVILSDPLPAGTATDWSIDTGPAQCSIAGGPGSQTLSCSAVDLASGDSYSVHIVATTSFAACTDYDNTATAHASNAPDAQDSASITCSTANLSIVKTADAATVNAGDPIGFTITVSNTGPGTATDVTLDDPLPAGTATDWAIDSGPANCSVSGAAGSQSLDCTAVDLAAGDSFSVHVTSSTSFAACTDYDNTATAHAANAPDVQDSATIVCNAADVSITKTADHSAPVLAGGRIGFTVEVKNTGAGDATGVSLSDPLPAGSGAGVSWAIDTASGTPGQFVLGGAAGSQTLSLASSTLPAGADYTVHIVATTSTTECGTYDNTATLTTGNANNPNPASAAEACRLPQIDLAVTKSGSPASETLGSGNTTWTMVVTNNGPDTATGVTASDPLPAGTTFVSVTTTQGSCTGGAIISCALGTMAPGASVTITLVTTPTVSGTLTNTVTVVGNEHETNTANNTATATVQVNQLTPPPPVFCVAVSKVTPKQLFVGRSTMLTIHLTQHGKAVKGIHVRIKGPKINVRTAASNSKGVVTKRVKMKKAGILIFSPIASKRCNTKRLGVTGVFTPPVTG